METETPQAIDLSVSFPPASTLPLFAAIRLDFARTVNGYLEPIGNNTFTSCAIVKVDI
jgi:hypothetical protein